MRSIINSSLAHQTIEKWCEEHGVPKGVRVNMRVVLESILTDYLKKGKK